MTTDTLKENATAADAEQKLTDGWHLVIEALESKP